MYTFTQPYGLSHNVLQNKLIENLYMPFQENNSVGSKGGFNTRVASHASYLEEPKANIYSLEVMHQDSGSPERLGIIGTSVCM